MRKLLFIVMWIALWALTLPAYANTPTTPLNQLRSIPVSSAALDAVAFSPDGALLASGGRDNVVRIWNTTTGDLVRDIRGHTEWVTTVAFNHDGSRIASGSRDNSVRTFNAQTGELLQVIGHHNGDITAIDYTDDGTIIASGARDSTIMLHQAESGYHIVTLDHFGGPVWDLAFSPDENILASSSEEGTVWLWGLWDDTGSWLKRLDGHEGAVTSLAWSPDGDYLLTAGLDNTVRLWDLQQITTVDTVEAAVVMRGHLAPAMGVGFSTDGQVGISAGLDGTVRLWDVVGTIEKGKQLSLAQQEGIPITNMTLNPKNTVAAAISTTGTVILWDTDEETMRDIIAQNRPTPAPIIAPERKDTPDDTNLAARPPDTPQAIQPPSGTPTLSGREIVIPSASIRSGITNFPLSGVSWAIDPWEPLVGHLEGTAWVNANGNMVLGGHSEYPDGTPGIFRNLYDVGIGDQIFVSDGTTTRRYVVVNVRSVNYKDVSVVYPTAHNRLTLITCDIPSYVASQNLYYERLVVIADEVPLS